MRAGTFRRCYMLRGVERLQSTEQRVDERRGLERGEVVGALAEADELDRHAQLLLHANTMPPLAVPSSLVSTTPVMSTTSANTRACARPFWPMVASSTSSTSSTAARLLDHPLDLAELVHQAGLGVQPAGGVDQHDVGAGRRCPRRRRRTPPTPGRRPRLRAPPAHPPATPQVCSWSAAAARKVSAAPSTTSPAVGDQHPGQLADRGGLAGAVDPDDQQHGRTAAVLALVPVDGQTAVQAGVDRAQQLGPQQGPHLLASECRDRHLGPQRRDDALGGGPAPRSAITRVSSTSSQVPASIVSRDSRPSRLCPNRFRDPARRARSRTMRPATASGRSRVSVPVAPDGVVPPAPRPPPPGPDGAAARPRPGRQACGPARRGARLPALHLLGPASGTDEQQHRDGDQDGEGAEGQVGELGGCHGAIVSPGRRRPRPAGHRRLRRAVPRAGAG